MLEGTLYNLKNKNLMRKLNLLNKIFKLKKR